MRALLTGFDALGIPPERWADVLADSRTLRFDGWCGLHLRRPDTMPQEVFAIVARCIYENGPLAYFMSTHVN